MAHYIHNVLGRLRVRGTALRGGPHLADPAASDARSLSSVRSAHVNSITGSILVGCEDVRLYPSAILELPCERGYIRGVP